ELPREGKHLRNVLRAITQLENEKHAQGYVNRNLEADGNAITIGIKLPGIPLDEIELRSIFADILTGSVDDVLSTAKLERILDWLVGWMEVSEETEDDLFSIVEELLESCRKDDDKEQNLAEVM